MKAGPDGNGTGGNGLMVRMSYTLTNGSGIARACLGYSLNTMYIRTAVVIPQSPSYRIYIISVGLQALDFARVCLDGAFSTTFSSHARPRVEATNETIG